MKNKIIAIFLSVILIFTAFSSSLTLSAEESNPAPTITISKQTANVGDLVYISLDMSDNPGIMAVTISITYNSSALTYNSYKTGFLKDGSKEIADHPDKNLIRFVDCESYNRKNNAPLITLVFKIKDDALADFYPIDIDFSPGDICNWKTERIIPKIVSGGVTVLNNGKNCPHKEYGDWKTIVEPTCVEEGVKERVCAACGHIDYQSIPKIGHKFSDEWIIDVPATATKEGTMSRHCIYCDKRTDIITFSLDQAENEGITNEIGGDVNKSDFIQNLIDEQKPEHEEDGVKSNENSVNDNNSKDGLLDDFKNDDGEVEITEDNVEEAINSVSSKIFGKDGYFNRFLKENSSFNKFILFSSIAFAIVFLIVI